MKFHLSKYLHFLLKFENLWKCCEKNHICTMLCLSRITIWLEGQFSRRKETNFVLINYEYVNSYTCMEGDKKVGACWNIKSHALGN
jgi:activator of HSP90 ATPase